MRRLAAVIDIIVAIVGALALRAMGASIVMLIAITIVAAAATSLTRRAARTSRIEGRTYERR